MERRKFLGLLGLGAGGILLDQAVPLNRVWSFPKEIVTGNRIVIASRFPIFFKGDLISVAGYSGTFRVLKTTYMGEDVPLALAFKPWVGKDDPIVLGV